MSHSIHQSNSVEETRRIARELGATCRGGEIIAIDGDLGAGKTRFVQGLAEGMGINSSAIVSPTFVLSQEHRGGRNGLTLVHIDAYRMDGVGALDSIGWDEMVADRRNVVAVEWASRISAAIGPDAIRVMIAHEGDSTRRIEIAGGATCSICGKAVSTDSAAAPFCSNRCRMADLNRWFRGDYSVSRPLEPEES